MTYIDQPRWIPEPYDLACFLQGESAFPRELNRAKETGGEANSRFQFRRFPEKVSFRDD
jgi:hypothetical protein